MCNNIIDGGILGRRSYKTLPKPESQRVLLCATVETHPRYVTEVYIQ